MFRHYGLHQGIEITVLKGSFVGLLEVSTGSATLPQDRFHLSDLAFRALLRILRSEIDFRLKLITLGRNVVFKHISELAIILCVYIGVQVFLQLVLIKIITILVSFFLRRTMLITNSAL